MSPVLGTFSAASARGYGWLFLLGGGPGLYAWGGNASGRLGLGDTTNRSSPTQIGLDTNWSTVRAGANHTLAIKNNNTLWSWGNNGNGELGLSDLSNRSSPVQVGALTNWSQVSGYINYSIAVKTDGTLWSWGYNFVGSLGLGDIANRSSPVQIGSSTNWSILSDHGYYTSHAINTSNTLFGWGLGTLSDSTPNEITPPAPLLTAVNRSSPVQIGSLAWATISSNGNYVGHACGITTGGALYCWGENLSGQCSLTTLNNPLYYTMTPIYGECEGCGATATVAFGRTYSSSSPGQFPCTLDNTSACVYPADGVTYTTTTTSANTVLWGFSSPVQVGALTNWSKVSCGIGTSGAIKTDGTLWVWGDNNTGQLGLGDTTNRSSPVQVGALTDWATISAGQGFFLAVKTNGTLWAWGSSNLIIPPSGTSSPVQIGNKTDWLSSTISAYNSAFGIRS